MAKKVKKFCPECKKEVKRSQPYRVVALEVPYATLFFHSSCLEKVLESVDGWDNLPLYLSKNTKVWYT